MSEDIILQGDGSTTNTMLAAALCAVGIPLHATKPLTVAVGDGIAGSGRITWYFETQSLDGKYKAAELIKAWSDKEWHEKNPEHPFAYIKVAFENNSRLIDKIKRDTPLGLVRRRGKIGIISLNASQHSQDLIFSKL